MSSLKRMLTSLIYVLKRRKGRKQERCSPPAQGLPVPSIPAPRFSLPWEKPGCCLGSCSLGSTTGSCRASTSIMPSELLVRIYSARLGVAFQHLLSSSLREHLFIFLSREATSIYFCPLHVFLCFQQSMEKVHSSTSPSLQACFSCTSDSSAPSHCSVCLSTSLGEMAQGRAYGILFCSTTRWAEGHCPPRAAGLPWLSSLPVARPCSPSLSDMREAGRGRCPSWRRRFRGSCPVLHWRRLCWARPSCATHLLELGAME